MSKIIGVGMAQLAIAKKPDKIQTQALGSCVGIVLYDIESGVAGMAHAMLPDINYAKTSQNIPPGKFVNSAIDTLMEKMLKKGVEKKIVKAKIAGGANMFPDIIRSDSEHIGRRNIDAAKDKLNKMGIPLESESTGGSVGRTITFDIKTGKLKVRSITQGEIEI